MKRLLVVSDPPVAPGYLPRLRFLCDYLVQKGYDVTVLTEESDPLLFAHTYPIHTIRMYSGGKFDWFWKTVWTLLTDWHNRVFAKKSLQLSAISQPFDLVLCTAFSDFPLGATLRIARAQRLPLICDIRDLDEQVDDSRYQYRHQSRWLMPFRRLYRSVHIRRRNRVLRAATAISTISPWHADFIRRFNPKVEVVYNGYDASQFYPADKQADSFTLTYIGSLFDWQRPALERVRSIVEDINQSELRDQQSKIVFNLHTPQHDPIAHDRLGDAIRRSGVMLVLTSPSTHGMLTTKFYEALGCSKPVLCVPSDQGALAELIDYTHSGIATDDAEQIRAFLLRYYQFWQQQGYTMHPTVHREEFSREAQCEHLEKMIVSCL